MKLILKQAKWSDYTRFMNLCVVDTMPHSSGPCWLGDVYEDDGSSFIALDVAFIGYNHPFRNNGTRLDAIYSLRQMNRRRQLAYINKNIRALSRVMVKPEWRGRGYATEITRITLPLLNVSFVECLTFADRIAEILRRVGFINYGRVTSDTCDYYLWLSEVNK